MTQIFVYVILSIAAYLGLVFLCTNSSGNSTPAISFFDWKRVARLKIKAGFKSMYAIIETGGKQYKVQAGDELYIEKLEVEAESEITFDKVIAVGKEDSMLVGAPYVKDATVTAKAIKNGKSKKIVVFTYRRRKNSKRKMGHRQPYTKVEITAINA